MRSYAGRACLSLVAKLFLRKSSLILAFAVVTFVLLVAPPQQLGRWSFESSYCYQHHRTTLQRSTNGPTANATENYANQDTTAPPSGPNCDAFPDTSGILLVMKTGASESFDKVPTQLMTMLRCLPDFLIFSDMNQNIAGHHIHDSLQAVLSEAKDDNPDFDIYRRQRRCVVDQENCNKIGNAAKEAWNLDKYKNIHIAEKVYQLKPGYNWYVFVDADTYVLWPNLVRWLARFDHTKRHYLGSVALIHDFPFGHGGSGYVVSQAAMEDFVGQNPGVAHKYDIRAKAECCGDYMFSVAIKETANISVEQMWPTINGEKPATLPFGPSHWCHPIVTMHHMNSEEVSSFWEFERRWYSAQPPASIPPTLLMRDIYTEFFAPKLQMTREDWDNLSDDRFYLDPNDTRLRDHRDRMKDESEYNENEKTAHLSFDHCRAACESLSHKECFQFKYEDGLCSTSNSFKLGKPVKRIGNKGSISGWDMTKIREWIEKQNCQNPIYPDSR